MAEVEHDMLGINNEHYFLAVLAHAFADRQHYDFVVLTGDLAQEPCLPTYQRLRDYLLRLRIPVVCLPGNHDDFELMQAVLSVDTVSCAKQHVFTHWQIICLNSQIPHEPGGYLPDSELSFLRQALQAYPQHHALIAVHHHCIPAGSEWIDTMLISNSHDFLTLLHAHSRVKAVIHGHIHQDLMHTTQSLQIFSTPSTCFQFTPFSRAFSVDKTAPGYRKLWLYPDGKLDQTVHRLPITLNELKLDGKGYGN